MGAIIISIIVLTAVSALLMLPTIIAVAGLTRGGSAVMIVINTTVALTLLVESHERPGSSFGGLLVAFWVVLFIFGLFKGFKGYKQGNNQ